ncbi:hypothetical protein [Sorangium sp. So ce1335]|uniref:hypothetical protein n=1 Tax=Sorangium sp. So ce1335 TaxID=3133335 RepID=UPI003F60D6C8
MADPRQRAAAPVERIEVGAYVIPTDRPESDGTLEWRETTLVAPDLSRPGMGIELRRAAAERFAV